MKTSIIQLSVFSAVLLTLTACGTGTPVPPDVTPTVPPGINPEPPVEPPVTPPTHEKYVIQLIATVHQDKAEGIKNQFLSRGYDARVSPLMSNGRLLYRVQIGSFDYEASGQQALHEMQTQYPMDTYLQGAIVKTP